eukprot:362824-Chlamydomonas_euryale.AAC.13
MEAVTGAWGALPCECAKAVASGVGVRRRGGALGGAAGTWRGEAGRVAWRTVAEPPAAKAAPGCSSGEGGGRATVALSNTRRRRERLPERLPRASSRRAPKPGSHSDWVRRRHAALGRAPRRGGGKSVVRP